MKSLYDRAFPDLSHKLIRVFGAAGTGKTTFIVREIFSNLDAKGVSNFLALSFTVAAKEALLKKEPRLHERQVRTLHSICFSQLGWVKTVKSSSSSEEKEEELVLTDEDILYFMKSKNIPYVQEDVYEDDYSYLDKEGNRLLKLWTKFINVASFFMSISGSRDKLPFKMFYDVFADEFQEISLKTFIEFVRDYIDFMHERGKYDYNYALLKAYQEGIRIDAFGYKYLILDEAQDLSPIMEDIILDSVQGFEKIIALGDDDQMIYSELNGAMGIMMLAAESELDIFLKQSWRVPRKVWQVANSYIALNKKRIPKNYKPRNEEGMLYLSAQVPMDLVEKYINDGKTIFLLFRHKRELKKIARLMLGLQIPHRILGTNQIEDRVKIKLMPALLIYKIFAQRLSNRRISPVALKHFFDLLKEDMKLLFFNTTIWKEIEDRLVIERSLEWYYKFFPMLKELYKFPFATIIQTKKYSPETLKLWISRIDKIEQWQNPKVTLGTVHQSKGLEADLVIYNPTMNRRSFEQMTSEYERRVNYVALTRAKHAFCLVRPPKTRLYNYELENHYISFNPEIV